MSGAAQPPHEAHHPHRDCAQEGQQVVESDTQNPMFCTRHMKGAPARLVV